MKTKAVTHLSFDTHADFKVVWIARGAQGRSYFFGELDGNHKLTPWRESVIKKALFGETNEKNY